MLPPASTIVPLDPDEFRSANQYAVMVMENEFLEEVPAIGKPFIRTADGMLGFSKHPDNLFAFAVLRYFKGRPDKFKAFMHRFFGLGPLLDHKAMKPYVKDAGDDEIGIHGAVFEVAATHKLSDKYKFEPDSFFQKVREAAARMRGDEVKGSKKDCNGGE